MSTHKNICDVFGRVSIRVGRLHDSHFQFRTEIGGVDLLKTKMLEFNNTIFSNNYVYVYFLYSLKSTHSEPTKTRIDKIKYIEQIFGE